MTRTNRGVNNMCVVPRLGVISATNNDNNSNSNTTTNNSNSNNTTNNSTNNTKHSNNSCYCCVSYLFVCTYFFFAGHCSWSEGQSRLASNESDHYTKVKATSLSPLWQPRGHYCLSSYEVLSCVQFMVCICYVLDSYVL